MLDAFKWRTAASVLTPLTSRRVKISTSTFIHPRKDNSYRRNIILAAVFDPSAVIIL